MKQKRPVAKKAGAGKTAVSASGETRTSGNRYSAPALEKGLDILEFLSAQGHAYSLAQLAGELGRTNGEIFRMLVVLEMRGYVARNRETDMYEVTDKLLSIGLQRPKYRAMTEVARPVMEKFAAETRYPCHLAIMSGGEIVVIGRVDSPDLVGVTVRVGYRQPALETGSGRCILAFMDEDRRRQALAAMHKKAGSAGFESLQTELDEIRRAGHLIGQSRIMDGVWDIAAPIVVKRGEEIVAALTAPYVSLVINPMSKQNVAKRLQAAAREISNLVGGV
ncbi:MAG: IclR family transcriptional regulator [Parvibaculum sp.]|uniref:IclR family transcriptional regulator n=1 Tax=Parvibaculum sp. TaxID=2024848 RepID=UPI0025F265D4|nr:IclR family transcriptional regulator [Parvibaculum sp.]MCE9651197.1 IclR family transcriptional regulator [Parvibaculum sp.]